MCKGALNETIRMTELRDPYSFPKLEGDDKFGPKIVRILFNSVTSLAKVVSVNSTQRSCDFKGGRVRSLEETKFDSNTIQCQKGSILL